MTAPEGLGECAKVTGLSVATISISLSELNAVLTAVLLVSNIVFVWWRICKKKRNE